VEQATRHTARGSRAASLKREQAVYEANLPGWLSDDSFLMRMLNSLADGNEQLQSLPWRQPHFVAELRQWQAIDQLHHEEGMTDRR
jgi:hypothetical protein